MGNTGIVVDGKEYRPVVDKNGVVFPGYYVSSDGRVASCNNMGRPYHDKDFALSKFHLLNQRVKSSKNNYLNAHVSYADRSRRTEDIHVLVARAWLPKPPLPDMEVNHKDGIKLHNDVGNLEWVTSSQNAEHARNTGLSDSIGEKNGAAKLTKKDVHNIIIMAAHGYSFTRLAVLFNGSLTNMRGIVSGKLRRHDQITFPHIVAS